MSHRAPYHNSSPSLSASNGFPLKDPETPTKSTQPRRPILGRQPNTFESLYRDGPNQPSDARGRKTFGRRVWGYIPRRRRVFRVGAVLLVLLGLYLYFRPASLSSSIKSKNGPSDVSGQIRKKTKPLHIRTNEPSRAPLPASVVLQSRSGHVVKNGILEVDMSSKVHPLYQLIRDAREEWDEKVARQSKTLKEAVEEYKRRNGGRRPPKGFDKWWAYVVDNNIPLPDEYDQISLDLLPFRALSPAELLRRITTASGQRDTYTIRVKQGSIRTSVTFNQAKSAASDDTDNESVQEEIEGARMRVDGQVELLRGVSEHIPDFTAVYSVHDAAEGTISWGHRQELLEYVEDGEYLPDDDELDLSLRGWSTVCGPSSPLRSPPSGFSSSSSSARTLISSHRASMDPCTHPSLIPMHGLLSVRNPHHGPLTPIFCLSKTTLQADVLGVPTEQYSDHVPQIPWEEKVEDKLLWRGSNTGIHFSRETPWRESHRIRMINIANKEKGGKRLLPLPKLSDGRGSARTLTEGLWEADKEAINKHYLDLKFTDGPIQCSEEDGTCEELGKEFEYVERMTHDDALHYKYVVDVDGNAWSARFQRLLASGSLIFKTTITPEWWTDRIQPWVHYIPIKLDYTDLHDTIAFFRGDLTSQSGEPALARQIATEGQEWVTTHWRREDMTAYVFRLYLEWARLLATDKKGADLVYNESMERSVIP